MSLTTFAGIVVAGLIILFVFAPSAFAGLVDSASGFYTATQLQPRVGSNEIICDLRVDIDATMTDSNIFFLIDSKPEIQINSIDAEYFECYATSEVNALNLMNVNHLHGLTLLDVAIFTPQVITTEIKLIDSTDASQQVTKELQNQLQQVTTFNSGDIIDTPFDMSKTFVVTNIPARNYDLYVEYNTQTGIIAGSVYDGQKINLGQAVVIKVPAL